MKPLLFFVINNNKRGFEGNKIFKNVQNALTINDVIYTTIPYDDYDVAHFFSLKDEKQIDEAILKGKPVVISACYSESDPESQFLDFKYKDGEKIVSISNKSIKTLNKANVVLVPTESIKQFLLDSGVDTRIEVILPSVSVSAFDFKKEEEKKLFYRYFGEKENVDIVISVGEYTKKMEGLNAFLKAAEKCPKTKFYYFGAGYQKVKKTLMFRKIIKQIPKNVVFNDIVSEDIYRSAMMNAKLFVACSYKFVGIVTIFDAMAAKCQIVARTSAVPKGLITNGKNGYLADFSETLTLLIRDYLEGKQKPTIDDAYKEIMEVNLEQFGKKLIDIYNSLLKEKE